MAKQTTSFRLPQATIGKIGELSNLFRESGSEVVERAIDFLYNQREEAAKEDLAVRLSNIGKTNEEK